LYGRWQVGEIELDSEADKDYINNMLEFKEMVTNLSNLDNHNAARSSKVGRSIEGERCAGMVTERVKV
jgi:PHP family Zn ribbon phosphoesterase